MPRSRAKYYLVSVGNALDVLSILAARGQAGVTEIVSELGISKAAVFRMLYTMKSKGFVHQDESTKKYRLAYRLFAIGTSVVGQDLLGQQLTPFLGRLAQETGETANLGVREGREVVHVNTATSRQALRLDIKIGNREPLHSTALGKVLLAHSDQDEVRALLGRTKLRRFTPNTITTLPRLNAELDTIRDRGYALDDEESYAGIRCIAVPLRDGKGRLIAALSLSAPASRFSYEKIDDYRRALSKTADAIRAFVVQNASLDHHMGPPPRPAK